MCFSSWSERLASSIQNVIIIRGTLQSQMSYEVKFLRLPASTKFFALLWSVDIYKEKHRAIYESIPAKGFLSASA